MSSVVNLLLLPLIIVGKTLVPVSLQGQEPVLINGPFAGLVNSFCQSEDGQVLAVSYQGCDLFNISTDGGFTWHERSRSTKEHGNKVGRGTLGIDRENRIWMYSKERDQLFLAGPGIREWEFREHGDTTPYYFEKEFYVNGEDIVIAMEHASGSARMWVGSIHDLKGEIVLVPPSGSGVGRKSVFLDSGVVSIINRQSNAVYRYQIRSRIWDSIEFGYPFNEAGTIEDVGCLGGDLYAFHGGYLYASFNRGESWRRVVPEVKLSDVWQLSANDRGAVALGPEGTFVWRKDGILNQLPAPYSEWVLSPSYVRSDGKVLFGSTLGVILVGDVSNRQVAGVPDVYDLSFTDSAMYATVRGGLLRRGNNEELFEPVQMPLQLSNGRLPEVATNAGDAIACVAYHRMWVSYDGGRSWGHEHRFDSDIENFWIIDSVWYVALEGENRIGSEGFVMSMNRGSEWVGVEPPKGHSGEVTESTFSLIPDVFPGPSRNVRDIYWIDRSNQYRYGVFSAYLSDDNGEAWDLRRYPDTSTTERRYRYWSGVLSRGTNSLSIYVDSITVLMIYPDRFDTLVMDRSLSDSWVPTRFGDFYLAPSFTPDILPLVPAAQFLWRHVDQDNWHVLNLMPGEYVDYSSDWRWGTSKRAFVEHQGQLYGLSRGRRLWHFGAVDRLQDYLQPYRVTVENGYGSGLYLPGDTVHIWSRELKPDEVSTGFLEDPFDTTFMARAREWHTTFIMPAQDVVVTAGFDTLRTPMWQENTLPDPVGGPFSVVAALPEGGAIDPRGAVLVVGDAENDPEDFFTQVESNWFVRDALARKFSVIAFGSEEFYLGDRDGNDSINWNLDFSDIGTNPDARRAGLVFDAIGSTGDGKRVPVWILALGSEGDFAARLAEELRVPAIAFTTALPKESLLKPVISPAAFVVASSDTIALNHAHVTGKDLAQLHYRNGRTSIYSEHRPAPLFVNRFARIDGVDTTMSQDIIAELAAADIIRNTGVRPDGSYDVLLLDRGRYQQLLGRDSAPVLTGLTSEQQDEVWRQLIATDAGSTFFSDLNELILDFFNDHRTDPGVGNVEGEGSAIPALDLSFRP